MLLSPGVYRRPPRRGLWSLNVRVPVEVGGRALTVPVLGALGEQLIGDAYLTGAEPVAGFPAEDRWSPDRWHDCDYLFHATEDGSRAIEREAVRARGR